jgi:glucose/mannose-6-phosphate isomerase
VLVVGTSGAVHAARAVAELAAPRCPVPVVVAPAGTLPAWVGADTLVVALGDDVAHGAVLARLVQAVSRGALLAAVSGPGPVLELARRVGAAAVEIEGAAGDLAQRAGFAPMVAGGLGALAGLGLLERAETAEAVAAGVAQARARLGELSSPGSGAAGELAGHLHRAVPLAVASEGIGALAAARLESAVNQNAKSPALRSSYPSFVTETLCGFGQLGDVTRQLLVLVELRSDHELEGAAGHLEAARPLLDEVVAASMTVRAAGAGALAQLVDLVLVVDAASLLSAAAEGVDPLPLPAAEAVLGRVATGGAAGRQG